MKIGILGSGTVGQSLAAGLLKAGNEIRLGTGHPMKEELVAWASRHKAGDCITTFAQAAAFGDPVFLCTNWTGTESAIKQSGTALEGKVVVDVTNPLDGKGPDALGRLSFADVHGASGGVLVQQWLPDSKVVKALNSIGSLHMDHPAFSEGKPTMFVAGNADQAKKSVTHILHELGWEDVVDVGGIEMSDSLEELCRLWCAYGFRTGTWTHAFSLLRK
ncbi:MAG TPA: NAD(P)-binding domain-containing protein [Chitinophagaceae bacterium]|nr:NAD(P)-binding domain-containing protein [Chitinophagaceae bacterium]